MNRPRSDEPGERRRVTDADRIEEDIEGPPPVDTGASSAERARHPAPGIRREAEPDADNIIPAEDRPGTL